MDAREHPRRRADASRWLVAHPWALIAAVVVVAFLLWARGTRTEPHQVTAVFSSAINVSPGLDVQVGGQDVGKITKVKYDNGRALVGLGIRNNNYWPLHRGTVAVLRFGSTLGNANRKVDILPGPANAPEIPNHGIIDSNDTRTPVEFDSVLDMLNHRMRGDIRGLLRNVDMSVGPQGAKDLNAGLRRTPRAIEATAGLTTDLAADGAALSALVTNTHNLTRTLAVRSGRISDLVDVASATFRTFADNSSGVRDSIGRLAPTLRDARGALDRVRGSLPRLHALVADLAPGAARLPALAAAARPAMADLRALVPPARGAVATIARRGPDIRGLLTQGVPFTQRLAPVLDEANPMIACITPYAPEAGGIAVGWSDATTNYLDSSDQRGRTAGMAEDPIQHYSRVQVLTGATAGHVWPKNMDSATYTKLSGQTFALPRPPGLNAGKPVFMPECGYTPDGLNPAKDPEDRR